MEDIPIMPFFWEVEPVVALANVKIPQGKTFTRVRVRVA
jgi:hypothetical protein